MNQCSVLCSTGTFVTRKNNRNYKLIYDIADTLHCDGLEFMLYESWYGRELDIANDLKTHELYFPVFHVDKIIGDLISNGETEEALSRFRKNLAVADILGSEKLVLHLWGGVHSDEHIADNFELYKAFEAMAREHGITLTIENIVCAKRDPFSLISELADEYPHIQFTFDIRMAAFHRQLDELYTGKIQKLFDNNITHIHVSDYAGEYMDFSSLPAKYLGDGTIDFERFFAFLRKSNYHGSITLEAPIVGADGVPNIEKANAALELLRSAYK